MVAWTGKSLAVLVSVVILAAAAGVVVGRFTAPSPPPPPAFLGVTASLYAKLVEAAAKGAGVDANFLAEGSLAGARQIALVRNTYSLFVSVDPSVIEAVLEPGFASSYIALARDRMVVGYSAHSPDAGLLANWSGQISSDLAAGDSSGALNVTRAMLDHLFSGNGTFGVTNPSTDPEGYRLLMELQLAGLLFYGSPTHYINLLSNAEAAGRVVTVGAGSALFSYVQSGQVDYDLALYLSAAVGASIAYVRLSPKVDLGDVNESAFYAQASVNVTSSNSTIALHGAPIVLAAAIPSDAPLPADAARIIIYLISPQGRTLMSGMSVTPLSPALFYGNATALEPTLQAVLGSSLLQEGG